MSIAEMLASLRNDDKPNVLRYGLAVAAGVAAAGSLFATTQVQNSLPILFLAVLISAAYGGLGPGLLTTALCTVGAVYRGAGSLQHSSANIAWLLGFLGVSILVSLGGESRKLALEREAEFRTLVDGIPAAVFVWDGSKVRYANRAAERITGFTRKELGAPEARDPARTLFRLRATQSWPKGDTGIVTKSGEERYLACSCAAIRIRGKACVLTVANDVTERKQRETELKRKAQLLDLAFEPIMVRDADDRIIYWNAGAQRLYGWTKEEALGQSSRTLLKTVFPNSLDIKAKLQMAGHWAGEVVQTTKDGSTVIANSFCSLHAATGEPTVILEANFDITERKRAEEALRRTEKLVAEARMAATVSHEINNPLEAVTNCLYIVKGEQERTRELLNTAERELSRVSHITRQTLAFYRDRGKPIPVDICGLVNEVVELLAPDHGKIAIDREYACTGEILGHPTEIRQVMINLVTNAIEAGGTNLKIRVSMGRDWTALQRRGLRVTIADNGAGIAGEHQRNVFQAFFTTKGAKGTGLGLWVTKGIVQKLEGSIRLRSSTKEGRSGTSVSIFFPGGVAVAKPKSTAAGGKDAA